MPPEKREAMEVGISKKIKERLLTRDKAYPDATTLQQSTAATLTKGAPALTPCRHGRLCSPPDERERHALHGLGAIPPRTMVTATQFLAGVQAAG